MDETLTTIRPDRAWFDWRIGEIWRYRDLIRLLVWRDFVSVYRQTILGPAWHLIRPLLTSGVFTVVFGAIAGLSTEGVPPFLFYLCGTVAWTYFASCLDQTARTFVGHAHLLGKVYFHRLVIPVSIVIANLVSMAIQIGILVIAWVYYFATGAPVHVTPWILLVPFLVLMLAAYALGFGIIVCALTTRYRDLAYAVTFFTQLAMYMTPVIYPLSAVPERFRPIAALNPLTPVLEAFRLAFLGVGTIQPLQLGISVAVMVAVLVVGMTLFTQVERTFLDTV